MSYDPVAELSSDPVFPIVLTQPANRLDREKHVVRARNVAAVRSSDGHQAHLEIHLTKWTAKRTFDTHASLVLGPEAATALAAELLGVSVAGLQRWYGDGYCDVCRGTGAAPYHHEGSMCDDAHLAAITTPMPERADG